MTDIDDRLRTGITALAEREQPTVAPDDVAAWLRARPAAGPPRRRSSLLVAAAVLVVALVAVLVVAHRGGGSGTVVTGPADTLDQVPFPVGLHDWGVAPIGPSFNPTPIWDGREVVVLGGDMTNTTDARRVAALDPTAGVWRQLPSLPFAPGPIEEQFVTGTRCHGSVVAWSQRGDLAALAEGGSAWQVLPTAPDARFNALTWPAYCHGDELLFPVSGLRYSLTARQWQPMATRPGSSIVPSRVTWTGHVVIAEVDGTASDPPRVYRYDPTSDTWTRVSSPPLGPDVQAFVWTGSRVVAIDWPARALAAYDPSTDHWSVLPDPPSSLFGPNSSLFQLVAVGGRALLVTGKGVASLGPDDRWTLEPETISPGWPGLAGDALLSYGAGAHSPGLQSYVLPA